ncbi:hypothetical protein BCR37DRAFT_242053 [Protomyces lactucae-debilis]|uniref:Apple domain-containing protein n=1 Tax=Protomyces lactucae-debilis TaxID=2754530 RepID=A0A1Y2FS76_PROLT|nr:uncharacterized protein BCR37DRAFT_242053 [Protomyces lactucae-debilis]ORY85565.1 hypothetical protein BCR37DRAFT_242053 [Protomyces lactucae-debilis]
MQSSILAVLFAAGAVSAVATPQPQSNLAELFEAAPPLVVDNDIFGAGVPEAIWALSEDEIVSIIADNSTTSGSGDVLSKRSSPPEECVNQKKLGPYPVTNLAVPNPDTPESFKSTFANVPQSSGVPVINFYQVPGWSNLGGSGPGSGAYGLKYLSSYDINTCAQICKNDKGGCVAFNLYIERDPTVSANYKPAPCSDPPSIAAIKCVLYKIPFPLDVPATTLAGNQGGYRASFQVRIAASVGYNSGVRPGPVPGYCNPVKLPAAVNVPDDSYIGVNYYDAAVVGSDASYCRIACDADRGYHTSAEGPNSRMCRAFVGYTLAKNGGGGGVQLQCVMYARSIDPVYATNYGEYRGADYYSVANSYLYNDIAGCPSSVTA